MGFYALLCAPTYKHVGSSQIFNFIVMTIQQKRRMFSTVGRVSLNLLVQRTHKYYSRIRKILYWTFRTPLLIFFLTINSLFINRAGAEYHGRGCIKIEVLI